MTRRKSTSAKLRALAGSVLIALVVIGFLAVIVGFGLVQYYAQKTECENAGGTWMVWSRNCLPNMKVGR